MFWINAIFGLMSLFASEFDPEPSNENVVWVELDAAVASQMYESVNKLVIDGSPFLIEYEVSVSRIVSAGDRVARIQYSVSALAAEKSEKVHRSYLCPLIDEGMLLERPRKTYVFDGVKTVRKTGEESIGGVEIYETSRFIESARSTYEDPVQASQIEQVIPYLKSFVDNNILKDDIHYQMRQTKSGLQLRISDTARVFTMSFSEEPYRVPVFFQIENDDLVSHTAVLEQFSEFRGGFYPMRVHAVEGAVANPLKDSMFKVIRLSDDFDSISDELFSVVIPDLHFRGI
jgi:hypothetical protein